MRFAERFSVNDASSAGLDFEQSVALKGLGTKVLHKRH